MTSSHQQQYDPSAHNFSPARSTSTSPQVAKLDSNSSAIRTSSFDATNVENLAVSARENQLRNIEWSSGRMTPKPNKKSSKSDLAGKNLKGVGYYNEAFALRESGPTLPKDAPLWVELRTNVILENEFDFLKSFSSFLSHRYNQSLPTSSSTHGQNPEHNIAISVQHSSCMIMSGTFEGCYLLTITALHSISSTVNKRNAALISDWLENNLGVGPSRGIIKFVEPDVANIAVGGVTVQDMMEREKIVPRAVSRAGDTTPALSRSGSKMKKSILGRTPSKVGSSERSIDHSPNKSPVAQNIVNDLVEVSANIQNGRTGSKFDGENPGKSMRKGKSMFNLFGRSQKF